MLVNLYVPAVLRRVRRTGTLLLRAVPGLHLARLDPVAVCLHVPRSWCSLSSIRWGWRCSRRSSALLSGLGTGTGRLSASCGTARSNRTDANLSAREAVACLVTAPGVHQPAPSAPLTPAVSRPPRRRHRLSGSPPPTRSVRAGCLDCLIDAYRAISSCSARLPSAAESAATAGARSAARALIALRQRELGMIDEGYSQRARSMLLGNGHPAGVAAHGRSTSSTFLPVGGVTRHADQRPRSRSQLRAALEPRRAGAATLRDLASTERIQRLRLAGVRVRQRNARRCRSTRSFAPTADVQRRAADSRSKASDLPQPRGLRPCASCRPAIRGSSRTKYHARIVRRQPADHRAGQARRSGSAVRTTPTPGGRGGRRSRQSIANVAMTGRGIRDARRCSTIGRWRSSRTRSTPLLGDVKALTCILAERSTPSRRSICCSASAGIVGDARYWRALNESELERIDDGVGPTSRLAAKLLVNAEVPKLAGLIAYRRQRAGRVAREVRRIAQAQPAATARPATTSAWSSPSSASWPRAADGAARGGPMPAGRLSWRIPGNRRRSAPPRIRRSGRRRRSRVASSNIAEGAPLSSRRRGSTSRSRTTACRSRTEARQFAEKGGRRTSSSATARRKSSRACRKSPCR